ncbi:MAG: TlpA family protein disulfide reductase [Roseivirga sp.]|nr:TlpA family protein disulfide reductase [Roseivirga sp.]
MVGLILLVTGLPFSKAQELTDPLEILNRATAACKQLEFIEYTSVYDQGSLQVQAQVIHQKADVADVGFGKAKVLVRGDRVMGEEIQPFEFSYDGGAFKFHEPGNGEIKVIKEPTPRAVGRTLGLFYYAMVKHYLTNDKGLDFLFEREVEYGGIEEVNGKPAIRLDVSSNMAGPNGGESVMRTFQWYLDSESYLPVKRVVGTVTNSMVMNNQNLINDQIIFDINADESYAETAITGLEAKTEGLLAIGSKFPDFLLQEANGPERSLQDVSGKVTIIDFWGTWCAPCLQAMPDLQELYDTYQEQGLNVVGISVNDKPGKPEKFIEKKGYGYQFLVQGDGLAGELKIDTFPTVYIVDSEGIILHAEKGRRAEAKAAFKTIIERNLN